MTAYGNYDNDPRVKWLSRGICEVDAPSGLYEVTATPPYWDDWVAEPNRETSPWAATVGPCSTSDDVIHCLVGDPQ